MKTCKKCGVEKELSEFSGRQTKCKACFNEDARAKRANPPIVSAEVSFTCTECNVEKKSSKFGKGRKTCKECCNEKRREYAKEVKEKADTKVKTCKSCKTEKSATEFAVGSGLCKSCFSEKNKEANNRPSESDPPKTCRKCGMEKPATEYRHQEATCKSCCKKQLYTWRELNKEQFLQLCKNYRDKESTKIKRREYRNKKYHDDLLYKLEHLYRTRIRECIKKKYVPKNSHYDYKKLLGCSWEILIEWLEFNMNDSMTWDNYGTYWHIDHVLPVSSFDFSKEEDRCICFNWSNLMPLEGIENIKKSSKILHGSVSNARKQAMEFLVDNTTYLSTILTDPLPEELKFLVTSGVLTTKVETKESTGSGEISEVR